MVSAFFSRDINIARADAYTCSVVMIQGSSSAREKSWPYSFRRSDKASSYRTPASTPKESAFTGDTVNATAAT